MHCMRLCVKLLSDYTSSCTHQKSVIFRIPARLKMALSFHHKLCWQTAWHDFRMNGGRYRPNRLFVCYSLPFINVTLHVLTCPSCFFSLIWDHKTKERFKYLAMIWHWGLLNSVVLFLSLVRKTIPSPGNNMIQNVVKCHFIPWAGNQQAPC